MLKKISNLSIVGGVWLAEMTSTDAFLCFNHYKLGMLTYRRISAFTFHIPVFLALFTLTTLNSSFLLLTHILKLAPLLDQLTSAVGCLPTTSISTVIFSLPSNSTFCRSPRFHTSLSLQTSKNLGMNLTQPVCWHVMLSALLLLLVF